MHVLWEIIFWLAVGLPVIGNILWFAYFILDVAFHLVGWVWNLFADLFSYILAGGEKT